MPMQNSLANNLIEELQKWLEEIQKEKKSIERRLEYYYEGAHNDFCKQLENLEKNEEIIKELLEYFKDNGSNI